MRGKILAPEAFKNFAALVPLGDGTLVKILYRIKKK
jgi:hypothetical protein